MLYQKYNLKFKFKNYLYNFFIINNEKKIVNKLNKILKRFKCKNIKFIYSNDFKIQLWFYSLKFKKIYYAYSWNTSDLFFDNDDYFNIHTFCHYFSNRSYFNLIIENNDIKIIDFLSKYKCSSIEELELKLAIFN